MATVMDVIQGISQVMANSYDGATDEDGKRKQTGLKRDEEVDIRDRRVIDGFKVKLSGNDLCLTYTTEVLVKDLAKKDKYEDTLLENVADIVSFLKKEYKKVTGSTLSLKEKADMKPQFDILQTSRIRTEAKVTCHYEVGGIEQPEEKDSYREKMKKALDKWNSLSTDKRPENDTRKAK